MHHCSRTRLLWRPVRRCTIARGRDCWQLAWGRNCRRIKDAPSVDTPLYPEASFSLHVALILILAFVVNKLSNKALEDLLSLIGTLLLPSHILPKTLYKFYKLLNIKQSDIIRHHFFPACSIALEKDTHTYPNPACTRHFSSKSEVSYFVQLPLEKHLQDMFSRPGFLEQINHRFERPNKHANTICTVPIITCIGVSKVPLQYKYYTRNCLAVYAYIQHDSSYSNVWSISNWK